MVVVARQYGAVIAVALRPEVVLCLEKVEAVLIDHLVFFLVYGCLFADCCLTMCWLKGEQEDTVSSSSLACFVLVSTKGTYYTI